MYGELPSQPELARWDETLMRHSAIPAAVEKVMTCSCIRTCFREALELPGRVACVRWNWMPCAVGWPQPFELSLHC